MTARRSDVVDVSKRGYYHCIARCVRRAFLCGYDPYCGKSFEHRREWIRSRLTELLGIFAIECLAYAVMNNHLHSVLDTRPDLAKDWSEREVAARWRRLFPRRRDNFGKAMTPSEGEIEEIVSDPEVVTKYRKRLADVSWFNRCLNEHIARRANAEDEVDGKFWQGRFKCQRLDGLAAVLTCSVYVDLNPIRAGIAKTPEGSDYTSVQDRIGALSSPGKKSGQRPPLVAVKEFYDCNLTETEYLKLVDATGRVVKDGKGKIADDVLPILERLGIKSDGWTEHAAAQGGLFRRVIAPVARLTELAQERGRRWFQGIGAARKVFA